MAHATSFGVAGPSSQSSEMDPYTVGWPMAHSRPGVAPLHASYPSHPSSHHPSSVDAFAAGRQYPIPAPSMMMVDLTNNNHPTPQSPSSQPLQPMQQAYYSYSPSGSKLSTPQLLKAPLSGHATLPLINGEEPSPRLIPSSPPGTGMGMVYGGTGAMVGPSGGLTFDFSYGALHFLAGWKISSESSAEGSRDGTEDSDMEIDVKIKRTARRGGGAGKHRAINPPLHPSAAAKNAEEWKRKRVSEQTTYGEVYGSDHKRLRTQ